MMFDEYSNSEDLKELQEAVKAIAPDLKLSIFTLSEKKAIRAGLFILEKGNKAIINKLFALGFEKTLREKTHTNNYWDINEPITFRLRLEKWL